MVTSFVGSDGREVGPDLVLADWQSNQAATKPDLINATALLVADHYQAEGIEDLEVRADAWVSMNGQRASRIIDLAVDLTAHQCGDLPKGTVLDP